MLNSINDNFIEWLVEKLGPVFFGSKPAELLSFSNSKDETVFKIDKIEEHFGNHQMKVKYKVFKYKNSVKVLFYNPRSLDQCLRDFRNKKFLQRLGYPQNYSLKQYIELLVSKIEGGDIPPEIGIFLGYPLKDIMGFMGHPSLKLTKVNGWRVYGDPRLSDKKYREFSTDRKQIKKLLEYTRPENLLVSI